MDLHNQDPTRFDEQDSADLQDAGNATSAVRGRGAAQVLSADANGAVVLPAGTELGDIRIEGRDLVVVGADGVRYVIPDGAIVVPQLVVGDVAIPPLNLAALLIGNEPQPAAGNPQSSGGNFASDVGPLQAAFNLGDLLPYTELAFAQPEDDEVIPQPNDRDPLVTIITPDQPAGVQNATTTVAEAGLPARSGEPGGSNAAANSETTSGTFVVSSPDGITSLTINGVAFTGVGQTIVSPRGTLLITSNDPLTGAIGFTYTLTDNLVGGTVADQFTVSVTDPDGDVATGTLTVDLTDDAPTARNDTDAVPASTFTAQTGNVITGTGTTSGAAGADTLGADNAAITRIASNNVAASADTTFDASGNLQVAGQYGTLLIKADGSYSYTRSAGTPGGVSDAFTYTLTDADGSASTATLTIAIADAAPVITSVPPANDFAAGTLVFEAGLPSRHGEASGTNAPAPTETTSGTVTFTGGDGPVTATINGVAAAPGATVTIPGVGTLVVNTFNPMTGVITYSFTLADNTAGDSTSVTFNIVITDVDGDTAPGTFTIAIRDDTPAAANDSATQATENAPVTVNLLGNDTQGADTVQPGTVVVVAGTLSGTGTLANNANGTVTYTPGPGESGTVTFDYTITDGDGDVSSATATIALLADSTPTLGVAGDNTVDEAALSDGSNAASTAETAAGTIAITTGGDTLASLVVNGVNVTNGGTVTTAKGVLTVSVAGGAYSYSYTLTDNTLADPDSDSFTLLATDSDGDTASSSLVVAIADDRPDAVNDSATQATENASVTVDVLANDVRGADGVTNSAVVAVAGTLTGAGTLTYNNNGTFTYAPAPGETGTVTFDYTITDGDGDSDRATATITLLADSTPTVEVAGDNSVDEAALGARPGEPAGSNAASTDETATGTIPITTGGDTLASLVINGTNVTAGGTVTTAKGVLTVSVAGGAYSYSYTLSDNTLADPDSDAFTVIVTDSDGDSASTNLIVAITDDRPDAVNDSATQATENASVLVDVLANDVRGADGVTNSAVAAVPGTLTGAGTLTYNNDGTFTYAPAPGESGAVTFDYTITDGDGDTDQATVTITLLADSTPTAEVAGDNSVDEAALGARPGAPAGSNAASTDETAIGTIPITTGGDTLASLVINGTNVTAGGTITTAKGVLTVSIANGAYSYSYTLTDNTLADPDSDSFTVVVTDSDGDSASTSLVVAIADDAPTANADVDSVREDTALEADGNVITGSNGRDANTTDGVADTTGADGVIVTAVGFLPVGGGSVAGTVNNATPGAYGTLTLDGDGSYRYALDNQHQAVQGLDDGETLTETFSYTLTDGDGDARTTTLTITIAGANDAPVVGVGAATVSEEGLPSGIADAAGNTDTTNATVASGTISISDADGEPSTVTLGDPGAVLTADGQAVAWSGVGTGTLIGSAGAVEVVRIAIDNTGAFTVTLAQSVDHATVGQEDIKSFVVPVSVSDGTATVPTTLTVTIEDDSPIAADDGRTTIEGAAALSGNVLANDASGADTPASVSAVAGGSLGTTFNGAFGTLLLNADGSYTYTPKASVPSGSVDFFTYTMKDADGDTSTANLVITFQGDANRPTAGTTFAASDDDALAGGNPGSANGSDLDANAGESPVTASEAVFSGTLVNGFGLDGAGKVTFAGLNNLFSFFGNESFQYSWNEAASTLTGTGPRGPLFTIVVDQATGNYTFTQLLNALHNGGGTENNATLVVGYQVFDSDNSVVNGQLRVDLDDDTPVVAADTDAVTEDGPLAASGNVLTGAGADGNAAGADSLGADGASPFGAISAVSFGAAAGTVGTPLTSAYGSLTLNADGSYTYSLDNTHPLVQGLDKNETLTEVFTYTAQDGDGDTGPATLTITINGADDGVTITGLNVAGGEKTVLENDLSDGSSPSTPALTQTGSFTVTAQDGIDTVQIGGLTLYSGGAITPGTTFNAAFGTLTITSFTPTTTDANGDVTAATIGYSYTLNDNTLTHSGATDAQLTDSFTVTVTDTDGSTKTDTLDVVVVDDVPTARADGTFDVAEQTPLTVDVFANDTAGADGVVLASAVALTTGPAKGTVVYNADGTFTYTPNAGAEGADSFTYTITDGDGDPSTATVTLNLLTDSTPVAKSTTNLAVDEDGFQSANADASPLQAAPTETDGGENLSDTSGVAVFDFKADVPAVLAGSAVLVDTAALDGQLVTLDNQNVVFGLEGGALVGRAAGAEVIRITLTGATAGPGAGEVSYSYSTTLSQPVRHATAGTEDTDTLSGVTIEVTDLDGDKTTGSFSVTVRDDVPTAVNEAGGSLAEGATVIGTLDFVPGADGTGVTAINGTMLVFDPVTGFSQGVTLMNAANTVAVGTITVKADGSYSFTANDPLNNPVGATGTFTVTDRDGDASTATIAFTVTDANAPTGGSAAAAVDDDGLGGGNAASTVDDLDANAGDAPADVSEKTFTGTLTFTDGGDAPATITFAAGVNDAFAQVGLERVQYTVVGNLLTAKVAATAADNVTVQARSGMTLFTVEITGANTGAYVVTLVNNVLHTGGPNNENPLGTDAAASIGLTVTDSDGSTAATTLNIAFDDDAPTASATSGTQVTENSQVTVDITGTYGAGADGVNLAAVTHSGATQGTVSYNGTGLFTYTPNAGAGSGANLTDSFTYTVVDADGDTATATITINLQPDSGPVANDVTAKIDDDGLAAGNAASNPGGTDADQNLGDSGAGLGNEAVWVGSLSVQAGANDTPLSYTLASAAGTGTVGTETVAYTYDALTATLTATVAAAQTRAGTVLFTVKIDSTSTGAYTVTLMNPIAHATLDTLAGDDTENNTSVVLTYTLSDADPTADSDTGLLTIDFDDDTPSASAVMATQAAENTPFDIALAGNFNAGADELGAITFTNPAQGTLVLNGATFTYTPNAGAGSTTTADSFTYTITDKDGDKVTATVSITLQPDSAPMVKTTTNLAVDEDGFATANADNGQTNPAETTGTNSPSDTTGVAVFDFKADVPAVLAGSAVLVDTAALDTQLLTLSNQAVVFKLEGGALVGRAGSDTGAEVIRITLTGANAGPGAGEVSYTYSTTLSQPVKHATAGTEDTATLTGVTIEVTDFDGDKTTGSFSVTVCDDVPSLDVTEGSDTGIFLTTQDAETDGSPTNDDTATATVGVVTAGFAGVFGLTFEKGADGGPTPALAYALSVTSPTSGLTSHNAPINLYKISDGLIVGSTAAANPGAIDATAVFSVAVAADGTVALTQYQQIDHAAEAPPSATPFDDQFASLTDGLITLTASSSLTDGDGDVASDSETVDIGANLRFADDGPALSNVAAGVGVTLDETTAGPNFLAPINGTSATAVITATSAFGADGPFGNTAAAGTTYGLALAGAGATTLKTAIGDFPITLVQTAANVIAGQYTDGTTKTAFTLTIGTDGKLTVVQNVALEHDQDGNTAGDYDDALNLAGLVNATITLTDFDGDTATQSAGIGNLVVFEDDGVDAVLDAGMVPAGSSAAIMGNVLGNDDRGADGSAITGVTNAGAGTSGTLAAGEFTIQGQYGSLTVNATTGAYTYTRTAGAGGGSDDVFTYTLTDNDGDFDTATLTISIGDLTPVAGVADATVDDEGLANGIAGGAGDIDANTPAGRTADLDQTTTEAVFKGTLGSGTPSSVPGDGANVYLFLAAQTATTIGQETVTYSVSVDGLTLIANIATSPDARTGPLFTVQITNAATGAYTLTLNKPVLHSAGGNENDVDIALAYQLRDADLDTSVANGSLSIKFDDDIPTASTVTNTAQTDDEGKAPFASASNEGALVGTDVAGSPPTATGIAGSLFAIGADGLGSIAITSPVGVMAIYDVGGFPLQETLVYATTVAGSGDTTLTARGSVSNQIVFTLTIGADGSYTFTQSRAIVHSGAGEDEKDIAFAFTVTDRDGDTANGSVTVTVDDDTAVLANDTDELLVGATGPATGNVLTDLAAGDTGDGDTGADKVGADGGSVTAITGFNGAGTVGGTTIGEYGTLTINADGSYSYTRTGTGAINDTDTFTYTVTDGDGDTAQATLIITLQDAGVTVGANNITLLDDDALGGIALGTGDDPDAAFTSGTLSGSGGDGTLTFAFATTGAPLGFSYVANGTGIDVFQGTTKVLVVTLGANSGAYNVAQLAAIAHPTGGDENNQEFTLSYSVTDADGDSAGGTLKIDVDDDTSTANVVVAATLTDDEGKAPFAALSIEGATAGTDVAGSPATVTGAAGALFANGADGFGSLSITPPTLLKAITTGAASGTTGTSRQEDVAYDAPTVAGNGAVTITARGVTSGEVVFTLTVNPDGSYTFTQSRALVHAGAGEDDKALNFGFTLTDGDGDTATGSLRIDVDDDTPANFTPAAATAINTGTAVISNQVLDTAGNGIFDNAGADGIGTITFASAIHGTKLSGPSGLLKSGGSDIFLYIQANGSLIASTDADPTNGLTAGTTVFTATLNAATGTYTIDFDKTIDNGSGVNAADFSAAAAGNTPWKGVDPDIFNGSTLDIASASDPNPDSTDLLFSPIGGGAQDTINSDSDDIGIGTGQTVDAPEALRIDLVQDLRRDPLLDESTPGSYLYDTHIGVTQFTFKLIQVNGGPNNTSTVRILASNVDDANLISQTDVTSPLVNTAVNLDHTTVIVKNALGVIITTGITVIDDGNNIIVTGLKAGYTVTFGAQANASFEAVTIENGSDIIMTAPATTYGGSDFSLGGFAFNFVAIGSPVSFNLPVVLTDGDGDTSTGNIGVTLNPVTPVVLDLDGDGVEFVDSSAGAAFDYNGDGNAVATAWAGRDDGILALDANGNDSVDSGAEIVFGFDGKTDLEGLAARYDSNHDGVLDAADADFANFGVWQDADADGVSDAGEFRTLGDAGIVSVSLTSDGKAYTAADGEVSVSGSGTYTKTDGTLGKLADAAFATNARAAQRTAELVTTAAVAGAMIDAAFAAAQPAVADGEHARALPRSMTTRVVFDEVEVAAERHIEARGDLLAARVRPDESQTDDTAHIRGETNSARLVTETSHGEGARAPEYFGTADAGPRDSIGGANLFASLGDDGMMHALLSLPAGHVANADLADVDAAAIRGALSDFTGEAIVNAVVDHFAPMMDGPAFAMTAGDSGMHLLTQDLTGSALATRFAANQDMGDDAQALLMAQA